MSQLTLYGEGQTAQTEAHGTVEKEAACILSVIQCSHVNSFAANDYCLAVIKGLSSPSDLRASLLGKLLDVHQLSLDSYTVH